MSFLPAESVRTRGFSCLALLLIVGTGSAPARETPGSWKGAGEIGVRSWVDERWEGFHRRGPIEHGKLYLIASLKQVPSPQNLVQPVGEAGLLQQLRHQLNSHGFREITANETPEIVLTVLYGRGFLRNPYLANIAGDISSDRLAPTAAESLLAAAINPRLYDKRQYWSYERKLLAAQTEKLFIHVTAWKYPGAGKERPVQFWKTTMVADEPDQNDLNALYPKMLAAGVKFFDRPMKEEEIRINPDGRVDLAPLIILGPDEPAQGSGEKRPADGSR